MQIAIISPVDYLTKFSSQGDIEMAIATICLKSTKYFDYYCKAVIDKRTVILDNGVFEEGKPMEADKLIDLAAIMKPSYLVAPDKLGDGKKTLKMVKEFTKKVIKAKLAAPLGTPYIERRNYPIKLMAVAQGTNWSEWLNCFKQLNKNKEDEIDLIGIPSAGLCFWNLSSSPTYNRMLNRVTVVRKLMDLGLCDTYDKQLHLLGCSNPFELYLHSLISYRSKVISCDSSTAIVHGMQGIKFERDKGLVGEKITTKLDFLGKISKRHFGAIQHNIDLLKLYAQGKLI